MQALATLLTGACRLSRRQVQSLLADLCEIHLSLRTLVALEADTTQALAVPYAELAAAVPQAPVLGELVRSRDPPLAVDRGHPPVCLLPR